MQWLLNTSQTYLDLLVDSVQIIRQGHEGIQSTNNQAGNLKPMKFTIRHLLLHVTEQATGIFATVGHRR
jgi:hypothetical protein